MIKSDYRKLPFDKAIEFFSDKLNLDTDSWIEGLGIIQNARFTVARAKGELLQEIREAVENAIKEGLSIDEFKKKFDQIADRWADNWQLRGNRAWRSQLIYSMNLRTAFASGRYRQMSQPRVLKNRPYWQWRHGGSREPRPFHLALDGKVFFVGDGKGDFSSEGKDFFIDGGMFPPIGFGCKCTVFSLSQRDVDRRGIVPEIPPKIGDSLIIKDSSGQETKEIIKPDKGFDFVPGLNKPKLKRLDNDIQKQVDREIRNGADRN